MVVNKPTIIIYTQEADSDLLHEVCSGIEEEGLLFEVHEKSGELDELAHAAAEDSMLGSGIGMSGQRIAMQMRRLPKGHNVFELNAHVSGSAGIWGQTVQEQLKRCHLKQSTEMKNKKLHIFFF